MKHLYSCLLLLPLLFACGGTTYVDIAKLPDTYQCNYMKDICKEAKDFENKYQHMSKEEKEEFKTLLHSYQSQCNDALEACRKSK